MAFPVTRAQKDVRSEQIKSYFRTYALFAVFIGLCVILAFASPTFLAMKNIINVLKQISINGILALGMTFVVILGGIDISVGSVIAVTGVVSAMIAEQNPSLTAAGIVSGILSAGALGAVVGFLVAKMKIAPFIATLSMMSVARGLALVISDGYPHTVTDPFFVSLGNGYLWKTVSRDAFNIPIPVLILAICAAVSAIILYKTKLGRYICAVGGNETAARVSGLNVDKVKFYTFVFNGLLCGVAGICLAARITSGQPAAGAGYELDAIAAVIIGGASLKGGSGRISGTIIGALIIGVLNNGLVLLNVSSYYQQIVKGVIITFAVILDNRSRQHK
jgi:ribose/xylose/arabinose/galactoside ABC-type transport system permease subunit